MNSNKTILLQFLIKNVFFFLKFIVMFTGFNDIDSKYLYRGWKLEGGMPFITNNYIFTICFINNRLNIF